jgi:hypothetical protein
MENTIVIGDAVADPSKALIEEHIGWSWFPVDKYGWPDTQIVCNKVIMAWVEFKAQRPKLCALKGTPSARLTRSKTSRSGS